MEVIKQVPKATLHRYPLYLKALRRLKAEGAERIMSRELADYVGIESTTIRRDFSFLGNLGKQGYGYDVEKIPFVIQYNKRDLPSALPVDTLRSELNRWYPKVPDFEAVASNGTGVFECLKTVTKMILIDLKKTGK